LIFSLRSGCAEFMTVSVPAKWRMKRGVRLRTPRLVVRLLPCVRFDHDVRSRTPSQF
jgi:hypothetical protein